MEAKTKPLFYQPEIWKVPKDIILAAQEALKIGIENTQELLTNHDSQFGRKVKSHKITAERLELELKEMKKSLESFSTLWADQHVNP